MIHGQKNINHIEGQAVQDLPWTWRS